jgi:hypothetical protein
MASKVRRTPRLESATRRWIWSWSWSVLVFMLCAAAVVSPMIVLPIIAAAALVGVAVFFPRTMVGLAVLAVVFVRSLDRIIPIDSLTYLDEAMVVLCATILPTRRLVLGQRLRGLPGQVWFATFAFFGFASGVIAGVPLWTLLIGGFLLSKGFILGWAVAQVDWEERHLRSAASWGVVVTVFCLLAVVANLTIQGTWVGLLANGGAVDVRFGVPSLIGPFVHPLDLGAIMAASSIALFAWRSTMGKRPFTFALMIATGMATIMSFRRTAIVALLSAIVWLKIKIPETKHLVILFVAAPIAIVVLIGPLSSVASLTYDDYIVGADTSARTLLTRDSFSIALERFPFGAGFGRFGSETAASHYSPEYVARGYPAIWGLGTTPQTGQFLTDTEWPAIVGETGLLGAGAFVLGLLSAYRRGHRLWRSTAPPLMKWVGLLATGWIVAYLVESVAVPVFTGPPSNGPLFALFGIVAAVSHRNCQPTAKLQNRVEARRVPPGWSGGYHDQ